MTLVLRAVGVSPGNHSGAHFREQEAPGHALSNNVQWVSRNVPPACKTHGRLGIDIEVLCDNVRSDERFLFGQLESLAGLAVRPRKPIGAGDCVAFLALAI